MKIYVLNCGYIRISESLIETGGIMNDLRRAVLTPDTQRVELPAAAFLIEHNSGLFLVDTGLSRDISPAGSYDRRASEKFFRNIWLRSITRMCRKGWQYMSSSHQWV